MTPGWKEVAKALAFVLLFAITGYNLYVGTGIFTAVFRGVVAFLIFQILNILITNVFVRLLSEYEYDRLKKLVEEEEMEEMRFAQLAEEDKEVQTASAPRPKPRPVRPKGAPNRPTTQAAAVDTGESDSEEVGPEGAGAGGDG